MSYNPYYAVSSAEKSFNILPARETQGGYKAIYASGEAHFFDSGNQNTIDTFSNIISTGLFDRSGLYSPFSNLQAAKDYSITDFSIFNPYIHYIPSLSHSTGFRVDTSKILIKSVYEFNVYSTAFRQTPIQ